ncbi:urate oxidase [Deinococcus sp. YIM 134068]|uniref:factor-independent urate hydroxylase n=1 Tax=Deinococcus lichenicola TaxID=3118910 RepID=UPI002F93A7D5
MTQTQNTQTQDAPTQVRVRLGENNYGKAEVNLFKVFRDTPRHRVRELRVRVAMTGDFDAAHVDGDNTDLVATDTVRNTIYGLAKEGFAGSPEEFGKELVAHFVKTGPKVTGAFAEFTEHLWDRVQVGGEGHDHAFVRLMPKRTARVEGDGQSFKVTSGIEELYVLKTTQSGWAGYLLNERFTTLPETHDRVMATFVTAKWEYNPGDVDYDDVWTRAYTQIQETFTDHYSPSLQNTLYLLGQAVLTRCPEISRIWFQMPNKHHLKYNLERFGLENNNEIFHVDPEPYGLMEGWVERA